MKLVFLFSVVVVVGAHSLDCTVDAPCVRFCCENCTDFDITDIHGAEKLSVNVQALKGRPCERMSALGPPMSSDDEWEIMENGDISISDININSDHYCLQKSTDSTEKWLLVLCIKENDAEEELRLYSSLILLSLPFLIATFVIYAWIEELRNLHGKCLMFYVLSLIILHTDLVIIQSNIMDVGFFCTFAGYVLYFFALLSNFWLSVMSFDIFQTFSDNFRISSDEGKRFRNYAIFAFSGPTLLTIILLVAEHTPIEALESFRPGIGLSFCAITNPFINLICYTIPLAIIDVTSTCFIVKAAFKLYRRSSSENSIGYTRLDAEKDRFIMYVKLFAFMTLVWSFEIFSIFFEYTSLIIFDLIHCLQGMVVFVIFVLHKNTRTLLKSRCCASQQLHDQGTKRQDAEEEE